MLKKNNKGQKILKEAKKIIPGGNQLLSKRSEIFLPNFWPNYYKSASGCVVKDLENKQYYDFAGMGVTSCTLGYSNKYINRKMYKAITNGSMCTLNSLEEFLLTKKLLKIHKWADMAKYTKSGGEACMVAIRIARAFSKKNNIAFCGYHGWHDWYLAANLIKKNNLDKQLLSGLSAKGVSGSYKDSIHPFFYNNIESLEKILKKNSIGIIIMEPMRSNKPENNFLKKVKTLSKKYNCILIFDEITSGFHDHYGGIHLKYKVFPDMAIFGKSIANGYPISAIIGKRKIMNKAQESFISSTMWTDRIGFVAAIATLEVMKKSKVQKKIIKYGKYIKKRWSFISKTTGVEINISGQDSMPSFNFKNKNALKLMTFFTQEMLKKGFLASGLVSVSTSYNMRIINKYIQSFQEVFMLIGMCLKNKKKIPLIGPIKHSTFRRLT